MATKTKMITETDKSWVAAIVDLKAKLIQKENKLRRTPQFVMYVESKQIEVVTRLAHYTGLKPEKQSPRLVRDFMRKNCDQHCPQPHVHVHPYEQPDAQLPEIVRWTITGAAIVVLIHNIYPYLTKPSQDRFGPVALQIKLTTPVVGQGSGMVAMSIRRLALLGWKIPKEYESVMQ